MIFIRKGFFLILFFLLSLNLFSQVSIRDSAISFGMLGATVQYQLPGADMADIFYNDINVGAFFQWKFKNNWLLGVEGEFFFNDNIKSNTILSGISTHLGEVISVDGSYAQIQTMERGFRIALKTGRVFPLFGPNPNSGLLTTIGAGMLQHKIRIDVKDNNVPELDDNYKKGYDHLTNGLALTEFIGYMHCSNSRLINFFAGFEFTQGFTKNRRDMNFDTMSKDNTQHLDLLFGFKAGWFFPLYKHAANKYYYN